jgi:hypothetical protein
MRTHVYCTPTPLPLHRYSCTILPHQSSAGYAKHECHTHHPCLYDLEADEAESNDQAKTQPAKVAELLSWVKDLESEYHPPLNDPPTDVAGYCAGIQKNGGWLAPWRTSD